MWTCALPSAIALGARRRDAAGGRAQCLWDRGLKKCRSRERTSIPIQFEPNTAKSSGSHCHKVSEHEALREKPNHYSRSCRSLGPPQACDRRPNELGVRPRMVRTDKKRPLVRSPIGTCITDVISKTMMDPRTKETANANEYTTDWSSLQQTQMASDFAHSTPEHNSKETERHDTI